MANVILDHSTPVQQSLNKLNRKANRLNIQIGKLKTQSKFQIAKINKEFEYELIRSGVSTNFKYLKFKN